MSWWRSLVALFGMNFSKGEFYGACSAAFSRLIPDLPPPIGGRLKLQRVAMGHGTDIRVLLYHVWDRQQPTLLDKHHFSYGVVFDPIMRYHDAPQWARFYANKRKIYDKRGDVVDALRSELRIAEQKLANFRFNENDQMIGLFRRLDSTSLEELQDQIYHAFLELLPYWHPRYAALIDSYGASMTREMVANVIAGRVKFRPSRPQFPGAETAYSRHVPAWLRNQVFERDGFRCLKCGATEFLHADHINPVSKGGLTVLDNLQTLCRRENLGKGDRECIDYRKVVRTREKSAEAGSDHGAVDAAGV